MGFLDPTTGRVLTARSPSPVLLPCSLPLALSYRSRTMALAISPTTTQGAPWLPMSALGSPSPFPVACFGCLRLHFPSTAWRAPGCRHGSRDAPHRAGRGQAPAPTGTRRPCCPRSGPRSGAGGRWSWPGTSRSPGLPSSPGRRSRRHRPMSGRAPGRRKRSPGGHGHMRSGVHIPSRGSEFGALSIRRLG